MFLSSEEQRLMDSTSYEYRNVSPWRGAQYMPMEYGLSVGELFSATTKKMLFTRNSSMSMMSTSVDLLLKSECSFTKKGYSRLKQELVSKISVFVNEAVSCDS